MKKSLALSLVGLLSAGMFMSTSQSAEAAIWDLYTDFDTSSQATSQNLGPDDVWTFTATNSAPATAFTFADPSYWMDAASPAWAFSNDGTPGISAITDGTDNANWDVPTGSVGLHHDGPTGYVDIDWVAPYATTVNVTGAIWGGDLGSPGRPQEVTVSHLDSSEVLQATILATTGFNTEDGSGSPVNFGTTNLSVAPGDIIRVRAARTSAGSFGAIAGVDYTVSVIPEPASMLLLGSGLMLIAARRKTA